MSRTSFHIAVPLSQTWDHIERLRNSVLECLSTLFADASFCHAVSMVATELVENAVKYGDWTNCRRAFRLYVEGNIDRVNVEVTNPVVKDSREVRAVLDTVNNIREASSAMDAYRKRLFAVGAGRDQESRLGLLRIAYEGNCVLSAALDNSDVLSVRARLPMRTSPVLIPPLRQTGRSDGAGAAALPLGAGQ